MKPLIPASLIRFTESDAEVGANVLTSRENFSLNLYNVVELVQGSLSVEFLPEFSLRRDGEAQGLKNLGRFGGNFLSV